jgi:CubicO group peptidase (beta-lactamase class C family)
LALPFPLLLDALNPRSVFHRSMIANPGTLVALDKEHIYARDFEAPSGGGVGTARAMAHAYGVFAAGGEALGLSPATLAALAAPAVPPRYGFHDECVRGECQYSLGFMKPFPAWPFGHPSAFGAPGAGGSFAFADPQTGIGYAYVTNRTRVRLTADPRDQALRDAIPALTPVPA